MRCDYCLEKITMDDIGYALKTVDGDVFCGPECLMHYYCDQAELLKEWDLDDEEEYNEDEENDGGEQ